MDKNYCKLKILYKCIKANTSAIMAAWRNQGSPLVDDARGDGHPRTVQSWRLRVLAGGEGVIVHIVGAVGETVDHQAGLVPVAPAVLEAPAAALTAPTAGAVQAGRGAGGPLVAQAGLWTERERERERDG